MPLKVVGGHAGLYTGPDGATHQMLEDIALMRVMPNMVVIVPGDSVEAEKATMAMAKDFIDKYFVVRKPLLGYIEGLKEQARDKGYVETYYGRRRYTPDVKSSNFIVRSSAERAAINMPIQGTASDIMKIAMLKVQKKLEKFTDADMLLQIHDSIIVEVQARDAEEIAHVIKDTMEQAVKLDVKITVDTSIADNWADL